MIAFTVWDMALAAFAGMCMGAGLVGLLIAWAEWRNTSNQESKP